MQPVVNGHTAQPLSHLSRQSRETVPLFGRQICVPAVRRWVDIIPKPPKESKQNWTWWKQYIFTYYLSLFICTLHIALHYSTRDKRSKGHWSLPLLCLLLLRWFVYSVYLYHVMLYYIKNFTFFFFLITSFLGNLLCFIINQYYLSVLIYIFHHWRYRFSIKCKPLY